MHCSAQGSPDGLEDGFEHVMDVAATNEVDVHGDAGVEGESAEEFFGEFGVEISDFNFWDFGVEADVWTVAEVENAAGEGFFHGNIGFAVALNAGAVAEGGADGLAEDNAGIFDGVVGVDLDVAFSGEFDVYECVTGEEIEHVGEEGDAYIAGALPCAVEVYADIKLGFGGVARDFACAGVVRGVIVCHDYPRVQSF